MDRKEGSEPGGSSGSMGGASPGDPGVCGCQEVALARGDRERAQHALSSRDPQVTEADEGEPPHVGLELSVSKAPVTHSLSSPPGECEAGPKRTQVAKKELHKNVNS